MIFVLARLDDNLNRKSLHGFFCVADGIFRRKEAEQRPSTARSRKRPARTVPSIYRYAMANRFMPIS